VKTNATTVITRRRRDVFSVSRPRRRRNQTRGPFLPRPPASCQTRVSAVRVRGRARFARSLATHGVRPNGGRAMLVDRVGDYWAARGRGVFWSVRWSSAAQTEC
jgi:hypothetical protein